MISYVKLYSFCVIVIHQLICVAKEDFDFYSYTVMDIHDEIVTLEKYRGSVRFYPCILSLCIPHSIMHHSFADNI